MRTKRKPTPTLTVVPPAKATKPARRRLTLTIEVTLYADLEQLADEQRRELRPRVALTHYHILFEVESWQEYPVDPFLLRHIHGSLYTVEAEWELTPLEAELLAALSTDGRA